MAGKERITKQVLKKAIKGSYGVRNVIAKKIGCDVRTVYNKLKQYPELEKMAEFEKNVLKGTLVELAQNTLLEELKPKKDETDKEKDRRVKVAMWVAERLGAGEGYNPTVKVEKEGKDVTEFVFVDGLHGLDKKDEADD